VGPLRDRLQAHKVPHLATPRQSEHALSNAPGSWTLRSAGGPRPALIVWGHPAPAGEVLDRFARAGYAVLSPSPDVTADGLLSMLDELSRGAFAGTALDPVGLLAVSQAADPGLARTLDKRRIPWHHASTDWDAALRWFTERLT